MALGEYGPRAAYFAVADGAVIRRFKDQNDDPQARPVTRRDGTIVFHREYKFIEGFITRIEIASSTVNGKHIEKAQWKIHIEDGQDNYVLTMHYNSAYAKRFINCAASVTDWTKRLRIAPWKMQKTDRDTGVLVADKFWLGVTLYHPPFAKESKYAPKYANDQYPPMVKVRVKGEDVWDDEEQMLFWEKVVNEEIAPALEQAVAHRRMTLGGAYSQVEPSVSDEHDTVEEQALAVDSDEPIILPF